MAPELAWLQLAASASLTLMSLTVSIVAAIFTYRNNFGWSPIVFVSSIALSGRADGQKKYNATIDIEIWNRRKYPLILRSLTVEFEDLELVPDRPVIGEPDWHQYRNAMILRGGATIPPQMHQTQKLVAPFTTDSLDALAAPMKISAILFDPRLNRTITKWKKEIYSLNPEHRRVLKR